MSPGAPTLGKAERDFIKHAEGVIPPVIVLQPLKRVNGVITKSLDLCTLHTFKNLNWMLSLTGNQCKLLLQGTLTSAHSTT